MPVIGRLELDLVVWGKVCCCAGPPRRLLPYLVADLVRRWRDASGVGSAGTVWKFIEFVEAFAYCSLATYSWIPMFRRIGFGPVTARLKADVPIFYVWAILSKAAWSGSILEAMLRRSPWVCNRLC